MVKRALTKIDPKSVLIRYLSDEKTSDIAKSYGITTQALGQHLMRHVEEEWKAAQVARAIARKERAEDTFMDLQAIAKNLKKGVDKARCDLSLACAREELKAAQWDLERVCRRIYGQDQPAQLGGGVSISIGISREVGTKEIEVVGESVDNRAILPKN